MESTRLWQDFDVNGMRMGGKAEVNNRSENSLVLSFYALCIFGHGSGARVAGWSPHDTRGDRGAVPGVTGGKEGRKSKKMECQHG